MYRKITSCVSGNFYVLFHSASTWILILYLCMWVDISAKGIREFCAAVGEKTSCLLFPIIMNSSYSSMIYLLGIFLLFLNVPFLHATSNYELSRMGRRIWLWGQYVYLFLASCLYVIVTNVICIVLLFPMVSLRCEWGRVFNTLLRTSARMEFNVILHSDSSILVRYQPEEAWILENCITVGVCMLLGNILFTMCLWIGKRIAISISGLLILFPIIGEIVNINWIHFVSPISWLQLSRIGEVMMNNIPSKWYILSVIIVGNAILAIINYLKIPRLQWT